MNRWLRKLPPATMLLLTGRTPGRTTRKPAVSVLTVPIGAWAKVALRFSNGLYAHTEWSHERPFQRECGDPDRQPRTGG